MATDLKVFKRLKRAFGGKNRNAYSCFELMLLSFAAGLN